GAIGNEGGTDVVYITTGNPSVDGTCSLVALKLNPTKSMGRNYEVLWASKQGNSHFAPTISGSPVVAADGTVYCTDNHSASTSPRLYAFKNGTNDGFYANEKWRYDAVSPGLWGQPILYTSGTTNYIVLVGQVQTGVGSGSDQRSIRVQVIRDDGTGGT